MGQKKVAVLLKGGLGNQLFQIAAGLYASKSASIEIFCKFTIPRETYGKTDALYFKWPEGVIQNTTPSSRLEKKLLALSLTQALSIRKVNRYFYMNRFIAVLNSLYFSIKFKERTHVISGEETGFTEIYLRPGRNLLNGYFQAHQYASEPQVLSKLSNIEIEHPTQELERWISKAKKEKPVVVHLRLGDYKHEHGIGVLPKSYYQEALNRLVEKVESRNLWVFTNEPESVNLYIDPSPYFEMQVIGEVGLNPAETLELMRFGSSYVIANSTFSWWGAFLAYDGESIKIMPKPWFRQLPSPSGISPENWIEIEYLPTEQA